MKNKDGRHPFKWMRYNRRNIRIDRDIVPLISKMWEAGIGTTNSCQEHCSLDCPHKYKVIRNVHTPIRTKHCLNSVWIAFESSSDLELLFNIVAEYAPYDKDDAMYHKMRADRFVDSRKMIPNNWAFSFLLSNLGVEGHFGRPTFNGKRSTQEMWIEDGCKKNNFRLQPQITIPKIHVPYVVARLDKYNLKKV